MSIVRIQNLTKSYRSRGKQTVANDNVSLTLNEGEVFGLFGHNGAGKTTIVNQMLGLLRPDAGSIWIDGENIAKDPRRGRYLCSLEPQAKTPIGELTPRQIVHVMGQLRGGTEAEVARQAGELFDRLEITEWADQMGTKLSGGVKRLTGFCMATVCAPNVIILDEPTNDVDPVRRRFLWSAIRDLVTDGRAVMVVTHNIHEAEHVVDRVAVLDQGKVLVEGSRQEVLSQVGGRMKIQALATAELPEAARPSWAQEITQGQGELRVEFTREHAPAALEWVSAHVESGLLTDYTLSEVTLEDVYVELVGTTAGGM